jgi:hypothetical protein
MAFALTVDVVPPGGGLVEVTHTFWGDTEEEARQTFKKHADGCEFLGPAIREGRTEEELEEVGDDERPEYGDDDDEEDEGDDDDDSPDEDEET